MFGSSLCFENITPNLTQLQSYSLQNMFLKCTVIVLYKTGEALYP